MKLSKKNTTAIVLGFIIAALSYSLWYRAPEAITMLPYANILAVLYIAVILLSPIASIILPSKAKIEEAIKEKSNFKKSRNKRKIAAKTNTRSIRKSAHKRKSQTIKGEETKEPSKLAAYLHYQSNIILVQISLFAMLYCLFVIGNHFFVPSGAVEPISFMQFNMHQLGKYLLFPWPTIAALSSILAIIVYKQQKQTSINQLTMGDNKHRSIPQAISTLLRMSTQIVSICIISLLITVCILMTSEWILGQWGATLLHGVTAFFLIFGIALILTVKNKKTLKIIRELNYRGASNYQILWVLAFILLVLTILYSTIIPPLLGNNVTDPSQWYTPEKWKLYWTILSHQWWIAWSIPLSLWLTHSARGLKVRTMILAQLLLPLLAYGLFQIPQVNHLFIESQSHNLVQPIAAWQWVLCLMSTAVLLTCFTYGNRLSLISTGQIEPFGKIKYRHNAKPLFLIIFISAATIFTFLQTGFRSLSFIGCIQFLPAAAIVYLALLVFPLRLLKEKIVIKKKKNRNKAINVTA